MLAASPTLKGVFALLLALSVGAKIAARDPLAPDRNPVPENAAARGEVTAFLERHGLRPEERSEQADDLPSVSGAAGNCRLTAVVVAAQGWHEDLVHRLASPQDQVFFVYKGRAYPDQPGWLTRKDFYWNRIKHDAGLPVTVWPVLGIIASPLCAAKTYPGREIAALR